MNRHKAGLLIWNDFLANLITAYLSSLEYGTERFNADLSAYSRDTIVRLKEKTLFIGEASRTGNRHYAEGFNLIMTLVRLDFGLKPIVIFRTVEERFLDIPYVLDYGTLALLPQKLEEIERSDRIEESIFDPIKKRYPYLVNRPIHRKVI